MLIKIDKKIILENIGIQTRPPVIQHTSGTPTVHNRLDNTDRGFNNTNNTKTSSGKLPTQNLNSFADNQQKTESNFTKSAGLRFLNHLMQK